MITSSFKRFLSYLIDFSILAFVASLLASVVYIIIGVPNFLTEYNDAYNDFGVAWNNYLSTQTDEAFNTVMSNFKQFMKYVLVQELVNASIYLVLVPLYLIVLPMVWQNQTLGRALLGLRVVKNDDKNTKATLSNFILRELVGTYLLYVVIGPIGLIISAFFVTITRRSLADRVSHTKLIDYNLTILLERTKDNIDPFGVNQNNFNNDNDITSNVDVKDVSNEYESDNNLNNDYNKNYDNDSTNSNSLDDEDEYTVI